MYDITWFYYQLGFETPEDNYSASGSRIYIRHSLHLLTHAHAYVTVHFFS